MNPAARGQSRTEPFGSARKLITVAALALMASSIPVFGTRFLNDMDFYTLFADKLLSGRVLYRDAMDTKPPLVFVHYALVFKVFGLNNVSAVKLVTLGWLGLSALVMVALRRALSPAGAVPVLAAPMFVLASLSGWGDDFLSSNTEVLANLPILVGVWLLVLHDFDYCRLRLLAGGCALGIACLYRYQSAAALLAYASAIVLRSREFDRKLARLVWSLSGATLPALLFVVHYARIGALADLRLLLAYQAHYARDADAGSLPVALSGVATVLAGLWPVVLLAGRQTAAILTRPTPASRREVFQLLFAAWSVTTFFCGKRFFPHYFVQAIPPLVLLASDRLTSAPAKGFEARAMAVMVSVAVVFTAINAAYTWTREEPPAHPHLVAFVEANTASDDEVLLWHWRPQLLLESKRVFATRLLVNEVLIGRADPAQPRDRPRTRRAGLPALWPAFLGDLASAPPKLIFDAPPGQSEWPLHRFSQVASLLSRYDPCQVIDDVCVYLRRD